MAGIDASIISGLKVPESDFLGTVNKANAAQTGILNNRLLGQQVRGKEALGKLIGQNTDPITGDVNYSGVAVGASKNPDASLLLPDIQKSALDRQIQMLQRQREQTGLTVEQGKMLSGAVLPFVQQFSAKDAKPPTFEDFQKAMQATVQALGPAADDNVRQRAELVLQQAQNNPAMILKLAQGMVLMGNPTPETFQLLTGPMQHGGLTTAEATTPTPVMVRDPQGNLVPSNVTREQFVDQAKGGPIASGPALSAQGLTPAQLAGIVTYKDDAGVQQTETLGEFLAKHGGGAPSSSAAPGSKNGRYPGATAGASAPSAGVSGPKPGVVEAQTASATQSAGAYQKDLSEAAGYAQRLQGLTKGYEALVGAETGPGAKKLQDYRAVLDTFGIHLTGADKGKVVDYAIAQKYLQDYANQRGAALGFGTDAARGLVNAANPGVQTPKGAALQVLNTIKGLERMQAAQVAAAQAAGVTPDKYADWRAQWNRSVDPAAFAPPKLTKEGWEAKKKALGDKWPAYQKGLNAALAAGVITPADLRK